MQHEDRKPTAADGTSGYTLSRRTFLSAAGTGAVGVTVAGCVHGKEGTAKGVPSPAIFPPGKALRVQPVLMYAPSQRQAKTSWRGYGAIQSASDAEAESGAIAKDLRGLVETSEFPIEFQPLRVASNGEQVKEAVGLDTDAFLLYWAGGGSDWPGIIAASKVPTILFVRHKVGAHYLGYEIAHWRCLRRNDDTLTEPNLGVEDVVVDDHGEVLWRLRALQGLKNARGTKMLAIGSLAAYSAPAQELGPGIAKDVWGYDIEIVPREDFQKRLESARNNTDRMNAVQKQVADFLDNPRVKLATERRFVENSFVSWDVCRELLEEKQAFNFGFDLCMGKPVIEMLDTPPCLVLALANDAGYTAYCHTDLSHTLPGVLLRRITGKPAFLCNTHFPHDGLFTVAHCAAPMRMNGRDYEPTTLMTHYESDYGAATKVDYPKGQQVSVVVSNLHCSRWHGFKGTIVDTPSHPACRSQMDIAIEGDWRKLARNMEGFHAQVVYGDYLREVGYALGKLGKVEWCNYSTPA
jgi:hypothetical protein